VQNKRRGGGGGECLKRVPTSIFHARESSHFTSRNLLSAPEHFFSDSIVFYVSYLHWLGATHTGESGMGFLDCILGPKRRKT